MSKRTLLILAAVVVALFVLALTLFRSSSPAAAAADATALRGEQSATGNAPAASALVPGAAAPADDPGAGGEPVLSEDEHEILVMYDEMRSAFEQYHTDCLRMGEAIETAVKAHTPALLRLRDKRDSLSVQDQVRSARRVEAAQGPRLKELRFAMEQAVAKCKHDETLREALRELGRLYAPKGAQPTQ